MYTHINLLGPYNSGTNVVHNLLKGKLASKDEGSTRIWKHSMKKIMIENYTKEYRTTLFVICYRPLYSWLKSCQKTPYTIRWDGKLDTEVKINEYMYKNIIELYEHYYNMYQYLAARCPNVVVVEYYKICDEAISYEYLQGKLAPFGVSLPTKEEYSAILNRGAKTHGSTVGSATEAIAKKKKLDEEAPKDLPVNAQIVAYYEQS